MSYDEFYAELKQYKDEISSLGYDKQKKFVRDLKHKLSRKHKISRLPTDIEIFMNTSIKLITKPTRTISGVSVIAIMTKPLKCPHGKCICCPGGLQSEYGDVPQSYTGNEPASMRAIRNDYDSYLQVFNRLEQYVAIGQNFDKIELIIMGGTFPSYDIEYQNNFIMNAFKAMNDFSDYFFEDGKLNFEKYQAFFEMPSEMKDKARIERIKKKILELKDNSTLDEEKKKNENSNIRCVALAIETRPDYAMQEHIINMLNQGGTRVELGVQSTKDNILEFLNRGHTVKDSIDATRLMKDSFLKVGYHMMLGLDDKEKEMFADLFDNDNFKPDALKIYPLLVVKGTKLFDLWKQDKFKPIQENEAIKLISEIKNNIPEYVRIMRVERDIPHTEIIDGIKSTNIRQYVHKYMKEHNMQCKCIRCKEIKNEKIEQDKIVYGKLYYEASKGKEVFITAKYNDKLVGFLRLRKPFQPFIENLKDNVVGIRELHVYGRALNIGKASEKSSQHKGIGKKLMEIAEDIAFNEFNAKKIAVISGIGVRNYYKKLGYYLDGYYMFKDKNN